MKKVKLMEMTWEEVKDLLNKTDIVLIPIGSLEQHGPHLPLATDTILAYEVAKKVAEKLKAALAPAIPFGISAEHINFSGTISLSPDTFISLIRDICKSLVRHGFRKIIFINAHGGNAGILATMIQALREEFKATFILANIWELVTEEFQRIRESKECKMGHADEFETSLFLAVDMSKVRLNKIRMEREKSLYKLCADPFIKMNKVQIAWLTEDLSESGVIGDPSKASKEKGELLINDIINNLFKFLNNLKDINSD